MLLDEGWHLTLVSRQLGNEMLQEKTRMMKRHFYIISIILVLASFFIFFNLDRHDLQGDEGPYAFRSLGYFDYLSSLKQTTPIQWFGYRPWWSYLAFHDHPPLFLLVQHFFFKLFDASVFVARLPSALAGIGSLIAVFFWARYLSGIRVALFSTVALAVNAYFVWTARMGFLESVCVFFLLLGLYFFNKGFGKDTNFIASGIFFGLSLLTKYTAFFAIPGMLAYLFWKRKNISLTGNFFFGVLLFLAVSSPIVIYNAEMYSARGHFDIQFSDVFKQGNRDWPLLTPRVSGHIFSNIGEIARTLGDGFSLPYALAVAVACIAIAVRSYKRKEEAYFPLIVFASMLFCFLFIGGDKRWLGVVSPFAAMILGHAIGIYYDKKWILYGAGLIALFSIFYSLNTNTLKTPIGGTFLRSELRLENDGYNQLDSYMTNLLEPFNAQLLSQEVVRKGWFGSFKKEEVDFPGINKEGRPEFQGIIVYDLNSNWSSTVWVFERWKFYRRFLIVSSEEFLRSILDPERLDALREKIPEIYFIESGKTVSEKSGMDSPGISLMRGAFTYRGIAPETIYNGKGEPAFYVYHGSLSSVFRGKLVVSPAGK